MPAEFGGIPVARPDDVGLSSEGLERIGVWMRDWVGSGRLPNALTVVARRGRVAFVDVCGSAEIETDAPMRTDTIVQIYSMTKPIVSVAALMLRDEEAFELDDPIARWIPAFAEPQVWVGGAAGTEPARGPITVRHLMTHASGLVYGIGNEGLVAEAYVRERTDFWPNDGPLEEVVERLAALPLAFHPGERWGYGVSTDVLGRLLEIWSGEPLDRCLAERVFGPLRMTDTGFWVPPAKHGRLAAMYQQQGEALEIFETPSPYLEPVSTLSGGGGLVSTAADYMRFAEMLRRGGELDGARIVRTETVAELTRNQVDGDLAGLAVDAWTETSFSGVGFGLGVSVLLDPERAGEAGSPGEYGWGGYASTVFSVDPAAELTIVFLTQLIASDEYPLRQELRSLAHEAITD